VKRFDLTVLRGGRGLVNIEQLRNARDAEIARSFVGIPELVGLASAIRSARPASRSSPIHRSAEPRGARATRSPRLHALVPAYYELVTDSATKEIARELSISAASSVT
jgi:hypothetical protein